MPMTTEAIPSVEELERQLDEILRRKQTPAKPTEPTKELTDENARKAFGMTLWELFQALAGRFGFEIPDEGPNE